MDQQTRNLILAVGVSIAILVGFQFFAPKPAVKPQQQQTSETASAPTAAPNAAPSAAAPAVPGAVAPAGAEPREEALGKSQRVQIRTPRLNGSIDLTGARIDDLTLVNYRETTEPDSPEIVLLEPDGTANPYFVQFGWVAGDPKTAVPGPETKWTSAGGQLTPDHPVDLTWDNGAGLFFKRH